MSSLYNLLSNRKNQPLDWLEQIANQLLRCYNLSIKGNEYAITEIEFYLYSTEPCHLGIHPDPFVHKDKAQLTCMEWYFHREKAASKSFTLKGLDLTFGEVDKDYGGILIRGLRNLKTGIFTEGPSNSVNAILEENKVENVIQLKTLSDYKGNALENKILMLVPAKDKRINEKIYNSSRYGLSDKTMDSYGYKNVPYRFRIYVEQVKKEKKNLLKGKIFL